MAGNLANYTDLGVKWTWADTAARNAQSVSAADLWRLGWQSDIRLMFRLTQVTPSVRWEEIPPGGRAERKWMSSNSASASFSQLGIQPTATFGSLLGIVTTDGNRTQRMQRTLIRGSNTASAVGVLRSSGSACPMPAGGLRWDFTFNVEEVCTNLKWFVGLRLNAFTNDQDPAAVPEIIGVGRSGSGDANVQFYRNDGAGTATKTNLGASFPAATAFTGYYLHMFTPDGSTWSYMLRNYNTGAEVGGTVTTDLPSITTLLLFHFYCSNGGDLLNTSLGISSMNLWQET